MAAKLLAFEKVGFTYESMSSPLLEDLTLAFPSGWTGIVGPNGAGKSTILELATGVLKPSAGRVQLPGSALYCEQRTDDVPELLRALLEAPERTAAAWRGRLGLAPDYAARWSVLSHGERKRAQIGVMLWQQAAVLALDEPTNHIDAEARDTLAAALADYAGIGLLVSHDRELLDSLCRRCLFVDPPGAVLRPGNYSSGRSQAQLEEESARRRSHLAKRELTRVVAEAHRRAGEARRADRRRSKSSLDQGDRDGRARIDAARVSGKDARAGRLVHQMKSRVERARRTHAEIRVRKQYETGIWMEGERSRRGVLFRLDAGTAPLGDGRTLQFPGLAMLPDDRIALTGPNGSGKSTLIRLIMRSLDLDPATVTFLPQEIDAASSRAVLNEARKQPPEVLGRLMTAVSRLGSRPDRLLESVLPSPGEVRKLLLALGIARRPHLIVMDEPTNHLDLPSIECLEDALRECPCGLLLASHDRVFLGRLTRTRWHIAAARFQPGSMRLEIG